MAMPPMHDLVHAARSRREEALAGLPATDAFRLVDGAGDGLPDIEIDEFAGNWLVSTRDRAVPAALAELARDSGRSVYAKRLDQQVRESPRHLAGPSIDAPFLARECGLNFEISFQAGYSQGIFLDQRDNRRQLRELLAPGSTLLNTFAYTGAFSIAAAAAGATTTTLDLSQPYLDWARRNFAHNQLDASEHHFCKGDTFHWLRRFARQGRRFDAIVLDPPTFSRAGDGSVFRVEKDYGRLVGLALDCLADDGVLLASTNCRKLTLADFIDQVRSGAPRAVEITAAEMPPDFTGEAYLKSLWIR